MILALDDQRLGGRYQLVSAADWGGYRGRLGPGRGGGGAHRFSKSPKGWIQKATPSAVIAKMGQPSLFLRSYLTRRDTFGVGRSGAYGISRAVFDTVPARNEGAAAGDLPNIIGIRQASARREET